MAQYRVAMIPGDGIGPEVTAEAAKVLVEAAHLGGFVMALHEFPLGASFYMEHGEVLPAAVEEELGDFDAIFLGAVGDPSVAPGILERGLVIKLRRVFDQYINYRPAKLFPGVVSPIIGVSSETCDMVVIRENTEGLYVGNGAYVHVGTSGAVATQNSITTGRGTERLLRFGFELAAKRRRRLTLVHKTNVLVHAGQLWLDVAQKLHREYPAIELDYLHVDAACQHLLLSPERFDVIVTDNLFGDILSDLTAVIQGGLGVAAGANLNPERTAPSMFEPIHGSAPDIAGKGCANPAGAILSAALLLEHIGEVRMATLVESAVASVLGELHTVSGTSYATVEIGERVRERLCRSVATAISRAHFEEGAGGVGESEVLQ